MTLPAAIALVVTAAFAAGDWVARARDDRRLEYVCKPAATAGLVAVALLLDPASDAQRAWFVAALVFSLAGDVFLMLPRDLFVAGLASFLVGHLCYIAGLWVEAPSAAAFAISVAVVVVAVGAVAVPILRAVRSGAPGLVAPVAGYIGVIGAMLASALASGSVLAAGGAALFTGSDSLIAWDRFVRSLRWAPVAIMVTYHLGQAGLTLSLV